MTLPGPDLLGLVFGGSEALLSVVRRSRSSGAQARDRSLGLLWGTIIGSVALAVIVARFVPYTRSGGLAAAYPLGFTLFVAGLAVRWWSIVHLGRFFTVDVAIVADQHVVDTGPYRWVRHPSYTGVLVAFLGYGLCLGNWLALAVLMVPITLVFLHRIRIEEAALEAGLGASYRDYAARTPALLPFGAGKPRESRR